MKLFALSAALTLLLASPAAFAQEASNQAAPWYVSSVTPRSLGAMNVHGASKDGAVVTVTSALYLTQADTSGVAPVDFIVTEDQYDCDTQGRNRVLRGAGYQANIKAAVFVYEKGEQAEWKSAIANSAAMTAWETACLGPAPDSSIEGVQTHEDVLERYRRQLQR